MDADMNMKVVNYFMMAICSPIFLVAVVLLIRLSNKYKKPKPGEERRKNPKLRSLINIMMATLFIIAITAAVSLVVFIYTGYMLAKG
jgi:hypothetical protein